MHLRRVVWLRCWRTPPHAVMTLNKNLAMVGPTAPSHQAIHLYELIKLNKSSHSTRSFWSAFMWSELFLKHHAFPSLIAPDSIVNFNITYYIQSQKLNDIYLPCSQLFSLIDPAPKHWPTFLEYTSVPLDPFGYAINNFLLKTLVSLANKFILTSLHHTFLSLLNICDPPTYMLADDFKYDMTENRINLISLLYCSKALKTRVFVLTNRL